jgi:hypothetical protein
MPNNVKVVKAKGKRQKAKGKDAELGPSIIAPLGSMAMVGAVGSVRWPAQSIKMNNQEVHDVDEKLQEW